MSRKSSSSRILSPRVRPEVQALVDRGSVTGDEVIELGCSAAEIESLVPSLDDRAFIARAERAIASGEAVENVYAPELLRRLKLAVAVAEKGS